MTTLADLRELDRRVAEEVMGWARCETPHGGFELLPPAETESWTGFTQSGWKEASPDGPLTYTANIPRYSTDPAACAEVKRRLRDAGISFGIHHYSPTDEPMQHYKAIRVVGHCDLIDRRDLWQNAGTEEEAVARFALACHAAGLLGGAPE